MTASPLEQVYRESWAHLLGRLVAHTGRIDLAEDALADAFTSAAHRWGSDRPANPEGWLFTIAKRRIIDAVRHEAVVANHLRHYDHESLVRDDLAPPEDEVDDRLQLLWLATHPALATEVRPALALRFVLGVSTARIAAMFLVPEATMAARLTRAKKRIAATGMAFKLDQHGNWRARSDDVARTLLLAYTAGYYSDADGYVGTGAAESVELSRLAADLAPTSTALAALAALVTLQHARRQARTAADGSLVTLADQDRTRWVRDEVVDGLRRFSRLEPTSGFAEQLRVMAAIAAMHAVAPSFDETDWPRIDAAYVRLEALTGSPMVRVNRIAGQHLSGSQPHLHTLDDLPDHHRVSLLRAELLDAAGDTDAADAAWHTAYDLCPEGPERRHIAARIASRQPS